MVPHALVGTAAEGHVPGRAATDVEGVGVFEAQRVTVGCGQRHRDDLALADGLPFECEILGGNADRSDLHHAEVAQQLLDSVVHERPVGAQSGQLPGVAKQGVGAQRQHVGGGLQPGDEKNDRDPEQLFVVQVGLDGEPAEDVRARVLACGCDQGVEHTAEGRHRLLHLLSAAGEAEENVDMMRELCAVRLGQPEQFRGDQRGKGLGEGLHQVDGAAPVRHLVQQSIRHLLDARAEFPHAANGEVLAQQTAVAGVVGRVHIDEHARRQCVGAQLGAGHLHRRTLPGRQGAEPGVGQHGPRGLQAGDQVADVPIGVPQRGHRAFLARLREGRGRVERATCGASCGKGLRRVILGCLQIHHERPGTSSSEENRGTLYWLQFSHKCP